MPPFRELYERSEQALEASLLASSSEYIPGDSKRRLTGLRLFLESPNSKASATAASTSVPVLRILMALTEAEIRA